MESKSYSSLILLPTYEDRLRYLRLSDILPGGPGKRFHVRDRKRWDKIRKEVVCRDMCYDLGIPGLDIPGAVIVHHIIPVDDEMYAEDSPLLYDPENLISCSIASHNYIHYGKWPDEPLNPIRRPGDTKLW